MLDIKNYEGLYAITKDGKVWGYRAKKFLKTYISTGGYLSVSLRKDGKSKHYLVHRLVAGAYLSNPNQLPCVNHKDENKTNNSVSNLEWCTVEYNNAYSNSVPKPWTNAPKAVYCEELDLIFSSVNQAADKLNLRRDRITDCLKGFRKTYKGYHWKYI